jgi:hypothetical protein
MVVVKLKLLFSFEIQLDYCTKKNIIAVVQVKRYLLLQKGMMKLMKMLLKHELCRILKKNVTIWKSIWTKYIAKIDFIIIGSGQAGICWYLAYLDSSTYRKAY